MEVLLNTFLILLFNIPAKIYKPKTSYHNILGGIHTIVVLTYYYHTNFFQTNLKS